MRVRCKGCGKVMIDRRRGIRNFTGFEEWDMLTGEVKRYVMCLNCGHKVERDRLVEVLGGRDV